MPATYDSIASTVLSSGQTSISVTGIPGTYTDLRVVATLFHSSSSSTVNQRVNSDFSTTYGYGILGTSYSTGSNNAVVGISGTNFTTTIPLFLIIDIPNYAGNNNKTWTIRSYIDTNGGGSFTYLGVSWPSTAAITAVNLLDANGTNLGIGSTLAVYGITRA